MRTEGVNVSGHSGVASSNVASGVICRGNLQSHETFSRRRLLLASCRYGRLAPEHIMGSTTDKIKGVANEAAGKTKQVAGRAIGSADMEADGIAQEAKGDAQKTVGKAKEVVKNVADKIADKAHEKL